MFVSRNCTDGEVSDTRASRDEIGLGNLLAAMNAVERLYVVRTQFKANDNGVTSSRTSPRSILVSCVVLHTS